MPRVVTAGVPMRMPLATIGGFWSNGIAFLLTVMPALPSAASATLPVMPLREHVDQHQVVVGAAADEPEAGRATAPPPAPGVGDDLLLIVVELRLQRFLEAHRLGRDDVHQRPALDAGEHRAIEVLRRTARGRAPCRRAGRAASCASWSSRSRSAAPGSDARRRRRGRRCAPCRSSTSAPTSLADRADPREVDDARIGARADHDHLRLVLVREPLELLVVDPLVVLAHAVGDDR